MNRPILDPDYWKSRLEEARLSGYAHHAVYKCHQSLWEQIEAKHREILARLIGDTDSVMDVGCGYGRLLSLMPSTWRGRYLGIDISPDFIELARHAWPFHQFLCGDIARIDVEHYRRFEWAVMVSFRPMVTSNLGNDVWEGMEANLKKCTNRLLFLEYDVKDEGSVE